MTIEESIAQWLQYEPRKNKPPEYSFYPLTVDMVLNRMKCQLSPILLKDRKILDLGCCIPFNELWCNKHGAKLYHGVEILREVAVQGNSLVQKHNKIFHDSIENFLDRSDLSFYDTIIAQSSIHSVENLPKYINKIMASGATFIFETSDKTSGNEKSLIATAVASANFDSKGTSVYHVQKWFPNLSGMKTFAMAHQYVLDDTPNKIMKIKMPDWSKFKTACWMKPGKELPQYNHMKDYEWKFNHRVAKTFDSHAPKHIPDYHYIIDSLPKILQNHIRQDEKILDVGCATGATIKKLYYNHYVNLVGTECSAEMLEVCPMNLASYHLTSEIPANNYGAILSNWTLQFNKNKKELLEKIYNNLKNNGVLILSEKTNECNRELYHAWKRSQGVTQQEILEKEKSLKGVMHCLSKNQYEKLLKEIGFSISLFNEKLGFCTWVAIKK